MLSLSEFIRGHHDAIIGEFAAFAQTLMPPGAKMSEVELRDHAKELLTAVVDDMQLRQTVEEQHRKSQGHGAARSMEVSGRLHAVDRILHGYTFAAVLAEFRALRASVLRLYAETGATDLSEVRRFNEAIDEALTESMGQFAHEMARAEAAVVASEDKYRTLFETMGQGFARCELLRDDAGQAVDIRLLEVNPAYERLLDVTVDLARGALVYELYPHVDRWWLENYDRVVRKGTPERLEYRYTPANRWFEAWVYPRGQDQFVALFEDITDRKRAEATLRDSEARQAFLLTLSDALRAESGVEAVGRRAVEMIAAQLGADRVYLVTLNPYDDRVVITHETRRPDLPPLREEYRSSTFPSAIRELFERTIVYEDVRTDARLTDLDRASFAGLNAVGFIAASLRKGAEAMIWAAGAVSTQPRAWTRAEIAVFEDAVERTWAAIERARAESALRDAHDSLERRVRDRTAEVRSLFQRLVSAQEEERKRIARDIHDQLGQQMTALRLNVAVFRARAHGDAALVEQADRTQGLATELDQSIDFLTWQLRPPALDDLGLWAALRALVEGWSQRFGVPAAFETVSVVPARLPHDVEANLYRIVQEALHNVAKHASATRVTVAVTEGKGAYVLLIQDDGRGFDDATEREPNPTHGMGLANMRERAALVDGALDVASRLGHGTAIRISVPKPKGRHAQA